MKKLVIQIPCYNEADVLPTTLAALPSAVPGYDRVEVLVIDDGSIDGTAEVARLCGVRHLVRHPFNGGLARAFATGLEAALRLGAHTIVNLDADNQYCTADIPKLVAPILSGRAMVAVGARPIASIRHFPLTKKALQIVGSKVIRLISKADITDATSGFRAIHCEVARQLIVFSSYTYTIEMLIQLGQNNIPVVSVPIRVNDGELRPSRLIRSHGDYVWRSGTTLVRVFVLYRPMMFFASLALLFLLLTLVAATPCLSFTAAGRGCRIASLLLPFFFATSAMLSLFTGFVCDSVRANRYLLEQIRVWTSTAVPAAEGNARPCDAR